MKIYQKIKYLLIAVGVICLTLSAVLYQHTRSFQKAALTATGEVTNMIRREQTRNHSYSPAIRFQTAQGEIVEHVSPVMIKSDKYKVGDKVEMLYDPANPKDAVINGFFAVWGLTMMFGYVGVAALLFGGAPMLWAKRKAKKAQELMTTGRRVNATTQGVHLNKRIEVNGKNPLQIHAQWQDPVTQKIHIFKSDNIWFDPSAYIKNENLVVYINPDNLKEYHMDISFLPEMAA